MACNSLSWFPRGDTAVVLGAGPIGLSVTADLKGAGAGKIVVSEIAAKRRQYAVDMDVGVFDPSVHALGAAEELKKLSGEVDGFDFALDCSDVKATFDMAIEVTTFHGFCVNVAIWRHKPIDYYPMMVTNREKFDRKHCIHNKRYSKRLSSSPKW